MTQSSGSASIHGPAWGARARDWAELQEGQNRPLFEAVLAATKVGPGTRLLDIGCGSGLAAAMAAGLGAVVSGLDAAEALVAIARERTPAGDFRAGEMEALPFADASFDVVVAFNSLQYAATPANALREAARVVRPGGLVAIGMWGKPSDNEYMSIGAAVGREMPAAPGGPPPFTSDEASLAGLLNGAGLTPVEYEEVRYDFEFVDLATAALGQEAPGVSQPALAALGRPRFNEIVTAAFRPFVQPDGRIRLKTSMVYMVARKQPAG
jgi:SAM-dependent methyltransferase